MIFRNWYYFATKCIPILQGIPSYPFKILILLLAIICELKCWIIGKKWRIWPQIKNMSYLSYFFLFFPLMLEAYFWGFDFMSSLLLFFRQQIFLLFWILLDFETFHEEKGESHKNVWTALLMELVPLKATAKSTQVKWLDAQLWSQC